MSLIPILYFVLFHDGRSRSMFICIFLTLRNNNNRQSINSSNGSLRSTFVVMEGHTSISSSSSRAAVYVVSGSVCDGSLLYLFSLLFLFSNFNFVIN